MQHGAEREKSPEMPADFVCPTCVYLYFLFIFTPTDLNVSVIWLVAHSCAVFLSEGLVWF